MTNRISMGLVAVTLGVLTAVACGGTTNERGGTADNADAAGTGGASNAGSGGGTGTGGANSTDGGGATSTCAHAARVGVPDAGGVPVDVLCDRYFDAVVVGRGEPLGPRVSPRLPASELARLRVRFETYCAERLASGGGFTTSYVTACLSAVESGGSCSALGASTCKLPGGSPCVRDEQCAAALCEGASTSAAGVSTLTCGTCAMPHVGEVCGVIGEGGPSPGPPPTYAQCRSNEYCGFDPRVFPDLVCTVRGDVVGASCGPSMSIGTYVSGPACADGLYCPNSTLGTAKCTAVTPMTPIAGQAGVLCGHGDSQCQSFTPSITGFACGRGDDDCAADLGCGQTRAGCSGGCKCAALTFAGPGEVCSDTIRCLQGECPNVGERCPEVIPDGDPCEPPVAVPMGSPPAPTGPSCDAFASCIGGKCTLGFPTCQPAEASDSGSTP